MSFILGVILFVGVAGWLDAKIPWPRAGEKRSAVVLTLDVPRA